MKMWRVSWMLAITALGLAFGVVPIATAQNSGSQSAGDSQATSVTSAEQLDEVMVTAQRRSERLQDVPIAVSVVSAEAAAARGITQVTDLSAEVPNLSVVRNSNAINLYIRGVGKGQGNINSENSVAVYVDGVYLAAPSAGTSFSLSNIDHVEVLKGPQGTLFGRNATGGVVQIVTREPTPELSGDMLVGYGNYNTYTASGYVSGGIAPGLAGDLALYYKDQIDGFGHDLTTNTSNFNGTELAPRGKLVFRPTDTTKLTLTGDYARSSLAYPPLQHPPGLTSSDGYNQYVGDFNTRNSLVPLNYNFQGGGALRVDQGLGSVDLVSISSYRTLNDHFDIDGDGTPLTVSDLDFRESLRSFSQEVQLFGARGDLFNWVVGGYFYDAFAWSYFHGVTNPVLTYGKQRTVSKSPYAQGTLRIWERTKLTVGLRYTDEDQHIIGNRFNTGGIVSVYPEQFQSLSKLTWRVALDYDFTDTIHGYVSDNRGINSGGFSLTNPATLPYKAEQLDAYEIGVKSEFLDRRVRANVAGFYYDYKNKAVTIRSDSGAIQVANAASARIYGFDADLEIAATDRLTLTAAAGVLNTAYKKFLNAQTYGPNPGPAVIIPDASGHELDDAPPFSGSASVDYRIPAGAGEILIDGTVIHSGQQARSPDGRLRLPTYTLGNTSVSWSSRGERFVARLWAKNLFDKRYLVWASTFPYGDLQMQGEPRTYGLTLQTKF